MASLFEQLKQTVLLCDGGTGSRVQSMILDIEQDYMGQENCTEVLNLSRPDIVAEIHRGYFASGSDIVQTNSFGGSPITLGEFGLQDRALEINRLAAEHARAALEEFSHDGRSRFVLGSIGPGTRLPTLGQIPYDSLEEAYALQSEGLIAGGVDGILVETCQDLLQIKSAVNGAKIAMDRRLKTIPILVQVTVETTGTLLVGADIAAAATVVKSLAVESMGLNCATGPQEMADHIHWLAQNWDGYISVQPNAGLPELLEGKTHYPLGGAELASWLRRFVLEDGVNLVGGCCGTSLEHISAVDGMLRELAATNGGHRPTVKPRTVKWEPSLASLYGQVSLRQENAFLSIGERCNANGSRKFKQFQDSGNWAGCVDMAKEQVGEGSHALDLCTAFVGRNEVEDMSQMVVRISPAVTAPLVIDSTELIVLEAALKLYGGKSVLNSINFEDGEPPAEKRVKLARKFGAAVIALTIDETGMAKDAEGKLAIAKRLVDFACKQHGLPQSDLLIDPLTFTICTGNDDDRKLGCNTLDAIEMIRRELPEVQIILGLSNISFGLNPPARHVLNSVYLDHALRRGMTGAIVHFSKLKPLHQIAPEEVAIAEDLIFDRRREGYDPLQAFIGLFEGRTDEAKVAKQRHEKVEDRLKQRIIDGDRIGLNDDLEEAMRSHPPLDIINIFLLDGMKVVGELFGAGKMQLPFVLQSAETMKTAVAWLEPFMERVEGQQKGTIVLATVKGDVHDIGKNLVDIILTNNGYRVVNLGIKQPIAAIMDAARSSKADAIGMSGLLVKSTVVMRENLEEMTRSGLELPVLLGGAALTRKYVEEDCVAAYGAARVAYARDAFDGLDLMDRVVSGGFDQFLAEQQSSRQAKATNTKRKLGQAAGVQRPVDLDEARIRRTELGKNIPIPVPPFWGARVLEQVSPKAILPYLNEMTLYQFQWGFRKSGKTLAEYKQWAAAEVKPILLKMLARIEADAILQPKAVYGYWRAAAEGNDVILFDESGAREIHRFSFPRQDQEDGLCLADFLRDVNDPVRDVIGLQAVTMGARVSEVAQEWFAQNHYQDYLYLHGIGVEMAEAMAEYVHKRIRAEWGYAGEDDREMDRLLKQQYRGSRYSFGYPACPNLADQHPVLKLLGAEAIGLSLSDEDMLEPEQSTSAIVFHHPAAKYFSV
ncbi:MAG: methionine synthase [Candidatus Pacebacteria bacterium]|nr:methionine synthase [Candidatus Paceibacterota bacterium]